MEYLGPQHLAGNYSKSWQKVHTETSRMLQAYYGNSNFSTRYGAWLCILSKIVAVFVVAAGNCW